MHWAGEVFVGLIVTAFAALTFLIIRFNIKRIHIIRAASRATPEQLEGVYRLVEECGTEAPHGFVLGRTNDTVADPSCRIAIPGQFEDFPWAGGTIAVETGTEIRACFTADSVPSTQLLGRKYRVVAVPRIVSRDGKKKSLFAPARLVKLNNTLASSLATICPTYPSELLAYLLSAGLASFEFDGIHQARIGTSPAWIQDPEFPSCEQCRKRMALIVQLPGTLLHKKGFHRGTFYLFGCKEHPDKTQSVTQYT